MSITYLDIVISLIAFIITIYYYGMRPYNHFDNTDVKCIKPKLPFLGSLADVVFRKVHLIHFFQNIYNQYPDEKYVGIFESKKPVIMIRDLELLKQVGIKDFDYFHDHLNVVKDRDDLFSHILFSMEDVADTKGELNTCRFTEKRILSFLTQDELNKILLGEKWKEMRAALSPAFTSSKMRNMFTFVEECAKEMAIFYLNEDQVKEKGVIEIEVRDSFTRYTNDVIATSVFGIQVNSLKDRDNEFYKIGGMTSDFSGTQMLKFLGYLLFPSLMIASRVKFTPPVVTKFFTNLVNDTMKYREDNGVIRQDMIHLLMEAKKGYLVHDDNSKETSDAGFATVQESSIGKQAIKRNWNERELVAQAFVFFIAGMETTSTLITFFFYEMLRNPDIQKKLQEEIDDLTLKKNGHFTYNDIQQLKYLDMTISETLRLWSPLSNVDRVCYKPYTLPPPNNYSQQSYQIKKDESIWIPIYGLLHDPKYFPNPEKFDPERFSDENKASIEPMSYLPFGIGPRNCIGSRFALMEAKLIAFHILSKFDIVSSKNTIIPITIDKAALTMKPKNGLYVGLKLRSSM